MITIRKGTKADLPRAFELIQELALYEKAPEEVTNTVEMTTTTERTLSWSYLI